METQKYNFHYNGNRVEIMDKTALGKGLALNVIYQVQNNQIPAAVCSPVNYKEVDAGNTVVVLDVANDVWNIVPPSANLIAAHAQAAIQAKKDHLIAQAQAYKESAACRTITFVVGDARFAAENNSNFRQMIDEQRKMLINRGEAMFKYFDTGVEIPVAELSNIFALLVAIATENLAVYLQFVEDVNNGIMNEFSPAIFTNTGREIQL